MGISLALYRVIAREIGRRITSRVIEAGRAHRRLAPETVALEGFSWVEKNRLDKAKAAALPAKDRKGHFFFRFETPEAKETWWTMLVDSVRELKISPEKLFEDDPRYSLKIFKLQWKLFKTQQNTDPKSP